MFLSLTDHSMEVCLLQKARERAHKLAQAQIELVTFAHSCDCQGCKYAVYSDQYLRAMREEAQRIKGRELTTDEKHSIEYAQLMDAPGEKLNLPIMVTGNHPDFDGLTILITELARTCELHQWLSELQDVLDGSTCDIPLWIRDYVRCELVGSYRVFLYSEVVHFMNQLRAEIKRRRHVVNSFLLDKLHAPMTGGSHLFARTGPVLYWQHMAPFVADHRPTKRKRQDEDDSAHKLQRVDEE